MNPQHGLLHFDRLLFPVYSPRTNPLERSEVPLDPHQTFAWISLWPSPKYTGGVETAQLPKNWPILPAIIDTGNMSTLTLCEEHLRASGLADSQWSFRPDKPRLLRGIFDKKQLLPTVDVDVWLRRVDCPSLSGPSSYPLGIHSQGVDVVTTDAPCVDVHFSKRICDRFFGNAGSRASVLRKIEGPDLPILGMAALSAGNVKVDFTFRPLETIVDIYIPPAIEYAPVTFCNPS